MVEQKRAQLEGGVGVYWNKWEKIKLKVDHSVSNLRDCVESASFDIHM